MASAKKQLLMTGTAKAEGLAESFLRALSPREKLLPSEWAEKYRILGADESSEPGAWNSERTPYARQIMDSVSAPWIEEVVCLKGAQVGWSEMTRNVLGYWVDTDPGPTLFVCPDRNASQAYREERIQPLVENTEAVSRHLTSRAWDKTKVRVKLDSMTIFFAWAGSKAGLKTRPIRYLVIEEPDEFPPFSSSGGDPISKAKKRTTTYADKGRAKILIGGTPTNRHGAIWKHWENCPVRMHLWVPCVECGKYQELVWKQVKWPPAESPDAVKHADAVRSGGLAYYECERCGARIRDHQKPIMLSRCLWASEDQAVTDDGRIVGELRRSRRIGFLLPSLYSPWVTFSQLAAEFIEAEGDTETLADFVNQRLAEPFEQRRAKIDVGVMKQKIEGAPASKEVPAWAEALIATADTQGTSDKDGHFYYVVRAWAGGFRSQLIDCGICRSTADLISNCLDVAYPIAGVKTKTVSPSVLAVDSGGPRWAEIYELAQADSRVRPTKGSNVQQSWMVEDKVNKKHGVVVWRIDTKQSKDKLYDLMHDADAARWALHSNVGEDYISQMSSEHKIWDPRAREEKWVELVKKHNHFWDCEQQQVAAAWRLGLGQPRQAVDDADAVDSVDQEIEPNWVTSYKGRWS